jgi:hypothetical protein
MFKHVRNTMPVCLFLLLTGCYTNRVNMATNGSDEEIRQRLLSRTPVGTSAIDVLSFVVDTLRPRDSRNAYYRYVDAYAAKTGHRPDICPTDSTDAATKRTIDVLLQVRVSGICFNELTSATWFFDEHDRLADVRVKRTDIGP